MLTIRITILTISSFLLSFNNTSLTMLWTEHIEIPSEISNEIPSLKKLCIQKIKHLITNEKLENLPQYKLTVSSLMELPEHLNTKITKHTFFTKSVHSTPNFYPLAFDESSNTVVLIPYYHNKKELNILNLNESISLNISPIISSFCSFCTIHDGKRILIHSLNEKTITQIHNWGESIDSLPCPEGYGYLPPYLNKVSPNTNELILQRSMNMKEQFSLLNITTNTLKYENSDYIATDTNNMFYLVHKNDTTALYKKTATDHELIHIFTNTSPYGCFTFNPNGKQLFIRNHKKNIYQLMSLNKTRIINFDKISNIQFNKTGEYMLLSQYSQDKGLEFSVTNTECCSPCIKMILPEHKYIDFKHNNIMLKNSSHTHIINVKKLFKINQNLEAIDQTYTFDDLIKKNVATTFETDYLIQRNNLYINEKYILLNTGDLVHIKSKKIVATLQDIKSYKFSPTGKMLFATCEDNTSKVFFLRNDFTVAEYLLHRFMKEKNVSESELSNYPDMQKIYNTMKENGKEGYSLLTIS